MTITLNGTTGITTPAVASSGGDTNTTLAASTSVTTPLVTNAGTLALSDTGSNVITASTNNTERMRIDSSGNLLVGTTSVLSSCMLTIKAAAGNANIALTSTSQNAGGIFYHRGDTGALSWQNLTNNSDYYIADADFSHYAFLPQNPTAWQFASDARIKTDIQELNYGLDAVMAMQPKRYKFIQSGKVDIGFIAQELRTVVPEAVSGEELPFDDADTPQERASKTLGVGKETLIPILVKAIQEQQAIITDLKARIETLENK